MSSVQHPYLDSTVDLLSKLIQIPSFSGEENEALKALDSWLEKHGIEFHCVGNNRWMVNKHFNAALSTILLNSHIDTVNPNAAYTRQPFDGAVEDGKLFGLGSNDAGAPLVTLLHTFLHYFKETDLPANICMAVSAEEENSGKGGMQLLRDALPKWDWALIGEPTSMQPAIAEKGLMVIDGVLTGTAGHAAHIKDDMAIYHLADEIEKLKQLKFERVSPFLGPVKVTMTQVNSGSQHNVVPADCSYVLDVRVNELYTLEEVFEKLSSELRAALTARSFRLRSSAIPADHPVVKCAIDLGRKPYGSPTLSDQALLTGATFKMGPGETERSHRPDEYITLQELEDALYGYQQLLDAYFNILDTQK